MSKQPASKGPGVLSKVVRFVTNPTVQWSKLDSQPAADGDVESRQVLREMIQRRRRNEFVRNREFDMLRKARRRDTEDDTQAFAAPSAYSTSLPSNSGERARTLEKIDEIEAQMSRAWLKRKADQPAPPRHDAEAARSNAWFRPHSPGSNAAAEPTRMTPRSGQAASAREEPIDSFRADFQATVVYGHEPGAAVHRSSAAEAVAKKSHAASGRPARSGAAPDSEMEEVAIRFANGDMAGAEAGLLDLLNAGGSRVMHQPTWMALFDLYRATGQHARFDDAALQFAARFGRSAPQWFSMQDGVQLPVQPPNATGRSEWVHWSCPPSMGAAAVRALGAFISNHAQPWRMDWRSLAVIESDALPGLLQVLQAWVRNPVSLSLLGVDRLKHCLAAGSPSHDRGADPQWWSARLALLQVLNAADEFDATALDYCVTYEVSPPAWEPPRCTVFATVPGARPPRRGATGSEKPLADGTGQHGSGRGDAARPWELGPGTGRVRLSGQILGDADAIVTQAGRRATAGAPLELDCQQLIRVDFGAAGALLNWVSACQGAGTPVSFLDVHRLIAVFFGVIGISDVATVQTRTD